MKLFPDQEEVFYGEGGLYELIEADTKKILVVAPCGFGKTVCAAHLINDVFLAGGRALFLCHLDTLRRQTAEKLESYGVPVEQVCTIGVDKKPDLSRPICVTSVQTLARRKELLALYRWDVVLLDEAHQTAAVKAVQPAFENEDQLVVGLTATPYRLRRTESMALWFTDMVSGLTPAQLVEKGRLAPLRYFGFAPGQAIDTSKIHTRAGEFACDELEQECSRPELLLHAVEQWQRLAKGLRTLVFAASVKHAEALVRTFREVGGVPAGIVTGETPPEQRQELFRQLHELELQVLISIQVLSIGFDLPSAECLLLSAPTKSRARHLQRLGRGARVWLNSRKKECLVIDQGGDVLRHGPLEGDGPWELRPPDEPGPGGGNGFPMKQCVVESCGHLMAAQVHICPECGAEQPVKEKQIRTDDLQELIFDKAERRQRDQLHRWILKAHRLGYLNNWVVKQYQQKYNLMPPAEQWLGAIYGPDPATHHAAEMASHWGLVCRKKNRTWSVALTAMTREFGAEFLEAQDLKGLREIWRIAYAHPIAV